MGKLAEQLEKGELDPEAYEREKGLLMAQVGSQSGNDFEKMSDKEIQIELQSKLDLLQSADSNDVILDMMPVRMTPEEMATALITARKAYNVAMFAAEMAVKPDPVAILAELQQQLLLLEDNEEAEEAYQLVTAQLPSCLLLSLALSQLSATSAASFAVSACSVVASRQIRRMICYGAVAR